VLTGKGGKVPCFECKVGKTLRLGREQISSSPSLRRRICAARDLERVQGRGGTGFKMRKRPLGPYRLGTWKTTKKGSKSEGKQPRHWKTDQPARVYPRMRGAEVNLVKRERRKGGDSVIRGHSEGEGKHLLYLKFRSQQQTGLKRR